MRFVIGSKPESKTKAAFSTNRWISVKEKLRYFFAITKSLYDDMDRADLFRHAAAMAYTSLLSLIPSLAAFFALVSLFTPMVGADTALIVQIKKVILQRLTAGTSLELIHYLERFLGNLNFGRIGFTGFAGILISLVLLLRQIELAFNGIFGVFRERNFFRRFIHFWTFVTLGTFIASLAVGIASGFNLANLFDVGRIKASWFSWAKVFSISGLIFFYMLLYKIGPNCSIKTKNAAIGAIVASILFTLANEFYGRFIGTFTNYRAIYGALAAIPTFLLWLYIIWIITLFGAVLVWRLQKGFLSEDYRVFAPGLNPISRQQSHMIQHLTVVVVLALIYRSFRRNDQGTKGLMLCRESGLPDRWVVEGIEYLLDKKLIAMQQHTTRAEHGDALAATYFPTKPAESVSIRELLEEDENHLAESIAHGELHLNKDSSTVILKLLKKEPIENMLELVNSLGAG